MLSLIIKTEVDLFTHNTLTPLRTHASDSSQPGSPCPLLS